MASNGYTRIGGGAGEIEYTKQTRTFAIASAQTYNGTLTYNFPNKIVGVSKISGIPTPNSGIVSLSITGDNTISVSAYNGLYSTYNYAVEAIGY